MELTHTKRALTPVTKKNLQIFFKLHGQTLLISEDMSEFSYTFMCVLLGKVLLYCIYYTWQRCVIY